MATALELDDIQGLIFQGYGTLEGAVFLRMRVADAAPARRWLEQLKPTSAADASREAAVCIAFSAEGFSRLGLHHEILAGFARPFREGMVTEHRRRVLGDLGENHPVEGKGWEWGASEGGRADALLFVYGKDAAAADALASELQKREGAPGWEFSPLPTPVFLDPLRDREHFGFADGIANPALRGSTAAERSHDVIAPGEILLGYPNESGRMPPSPRVPRGGGGSSAVVPKGDFGRNGSYLVFRQLEQRVVRFWEYLLEEAESKEEGAVVYAAKMVGRWPNGAPLVKWPAKEPEGDRKKDDDFLFAGDPLGHACPLGAHIRRTHPRDAIPSPEPLGPERSLALSRRRRILRRGRPYGIRVDGWPRPSAIVKSGDPDTGRGLHFVCFNADLENQFEFLQQTWVSSRKLALLGNDADPLLSNPAWPERAGPSEFTIQAASGNRRLSGLPAFVRVRGGAYLFMPGLEALRFLARLEP